MATAWAIDAGPTVNCLKPFVIPDIWYESDKTNEDVDSNNYMDPSTLRARGNTQDGESWKYEPASIGGEDYYMPYDPSCRRSRWPDPRPDTAARLRNGARLPGRRRAPDAHQASDRQRERAVRSRAHGERLLAAGLRRTRTETYGTRSATVAPRPPSATPCPTSTGGHTAVGTVHGVRRPRSRRTRSAPGTRRPAGRELGLLATGPRARG